MGRCTQEVKGAASRLVNLSTEVHQAHTTDVDANESESGSSEDGSPPGSRQLTSVPAPRPTSETFLDSVASACDAYLKQLRSDEATRSAPSLIQDAFVLSRYSASSAPVTSAATSFVRREAAVLHAAMGATTAALPRALGAIPATERREFWLQNRVPPLTALLLYNLCQTEAASGDTPGPRHALTARARVGVPACLARDAGGLRVGYRGCRRAAAPIIPAPPRRLDRGPLARR